MKKQIAVVGGGYGGLTLAFFLEKAGHAVTVFEQEERAGGHLCTVFHKKECCELGVVLGTSEALIKFLRHLGVKAEYKYFHRNFLGADGKKQAQIAPDEIAAFQEQLKRLPEILAPYQGALNALGWENIPDALTQSFESWCHKNKLHTLLKVYTPHLVAFGFGKSSEIPAIYALKYLDLMTLSSMIESRKLIAFSNGATEIMTRLAQKLEDLRLNTPVTGIIPGEHHRVTIASPVGKEDFDAVVITVPLDQSVIQSPEHASLMGCYRRKAYNVLAYVAQQNYRTTTYFSHNFEKEGHLLLLYSSKPDKPGPLLTAYATGELPIKDLKAQIDVDLKAAGFKADRLFAYKQWQTFPHVSGAKIKDGFYDQVKTCQGKQGIYFSGSLTCFPTLDKLTQYLSDFANRYFGSEE
ncbi:FAD-dependent oxidoreductase [uncultured Acetobacterium sp.]|uniref:FAD-dependent oxidoreductase n=1 Tax=uncultured Acetobacterium sp. TaxID=217139 RepID=UPI0025EBD5E1|nr:FAD-dependent oxidoreductase [uncultured Acetobacterium sp.]MDP2842647.1 FAD-dependent oxidoreductase [Acetobacterium sp.]